jgi:oligopeptide transport system substrate-binding protein
MLTKLKNLFFLNGMCAALLIVSCSDDKTSGPLTVSIIGSRQQVVQSLTHGRTAAGRHILGATAQGLVSLDAEGGVVPALAQRWIVVDQGLGYIFRLRRAYWADNSRIDAREVARLVNARISAAAQAEPYSNMASVISVVAMTTDVIEIRLRVARPNFLSLLAQPNFAVALRSGGTGPLRKEIAQGGVLLTPARRRNAVNDNDIIDPENNSRLIRGERASLAISRFALGQSDLVLGGTIGDLPVTQAAKADANALRLDPARGLFGLAVMEPTQFLSNDQVREALSMAIDRKGLIDLFQGAGWSKADTIAFPLVRPALGFTSPKWTMKSLEARKIDAREIIRNWKASNGSHAASVRMSMPKGPGYDLIYHFLAHEFAEIGVTTKLVEREGDLILIDEVAPIDSAFWYLGRISCARGLICDDTAEALLRKASITENPAERNALLEQAAQGAIMANGYIALATPVRWSLVGPRVNGYKASPRSFHPLNRISTTPE